MKLKRPIFKPLAQNKTRTMNKLLILLFGILLISCSQNKKENLRSDEKFVEIVKVSENFDWLLGKWIRLNEEEGMETFENWEKISDTEYSGIGFTMQNGDTLKQERIKLIKSNSSWNLEVKVPEESESIIFNMTSYDMEEFTCENEVIDFPNKIKYWKNGDKINASVSGGEMEIPFEFERLK